MTILRTFLIMVVPLFLLLAGVNGALLYILERNEAADGIETEALAAAVTTAAFAGANDDLAATLSEPRRAAGLRASAANIRGLDGLYVAQPGQPARRIAGTGPQVDPGRFAMPAKPRILRDITSAEGHHVVTALAPATAGTFVIAQIDADPLFDQVAGLQRLIVTLVAGAGVLGVVLAWLVARQITRELARNSAMIEAIRTDAPEVSPEGLKIRETRDLANAVRLMRTSVAGRVARNDRDLAARDRQRDEAGSVAAYRESAMATLETTAAGRAVAVRLLGDAPAGCFFALAAEGDRAALVIGECAGDSPASALACALSARRYFERRTLAGAPESSVERGRQAFDLTRVAWIAWSAAESAPAQSLGLLEGEAAQAEAYVARSPDLRPADIIDDVTALLRPRGVLGVVGASGQAGQG